MKLCFTLLLIFSISISNAESIELNETPPDKRQDFELMKLANPETGQIPEGIRMKEMEFARNLELRNKGHKFRNESILNNQWVSAGPANVGGRTRAVGIDVRYNGSSNKVILAGGVSGGMYKSVDGGQSWVMTTDKMYCPSVSCIAQDTRQGKENNWYIGSGEFIGNSASSREHRFTGYYNGTGVYHSSDNGSSWRLCSAFDNFQQGKFRSKSYIWNIALDFTDSDNPIIYIACYGGIFRSTDNGDSFDLVLGEEMDGQQYGYSMVSDILFCEDGAKYAYLSVLDEYSYYGQTTQNQTHGLFRSEDGINWTDITPSHQFGGAHRRIVFAEGNPENNEIFLLGSTPGFGKKFHYSSSIRDYHCLLKYEYISGDGSGDGGQWTDYSSYLPFEYTSQGSYNMVIALNPVNYDNIYIGGRNLYMGKLSNIMNGFFQVGGYYSYDIYNNCNIEPEEWENHADQHTIDFFPNNPEQILVGTDGGLFKAPNSFSVCMDWETLNNNYLTTQFYTVAVDEQHSNNNMLMGGLQDNNTLATFDDTGDWYAINSGDGSYCSFGKESKYMFVSSQYAILSRIIYDPDDQSYVHRIFNENGDIDNFSFVTPFVLDPETKENLFIISRTRLYRLTNLYDANGNISYEIINYLDNSEYFNQGLTVSKKTGTLWAGGYKTVGSTYRPFLLRIKNPTTSSMISDKFQPENFPEKGYIECIAVDPENDDEIFVVFSNYGIPSLFYSQDGGNNFTDIGGNLEENPDGSGNGPSIRWIEPVYVNNNPNPIYLLGTSIGLYATEKIEGSDTNWAQIAKESIGNVVVPMIRVRQSDGYCAVATHGRGVFKTFIEPNKVEGKTSSMAGIGNFIPNPAKAKSSIFISGFEGKCFEIKIYDIAGRVIKDYGSITIHSGYQEFQADIEGLGCGEYYVHFSNEFKSFTRKLIIE